MEVSLARLTFVTIVALLRTTRRQAGGIDPGLTAVTTIAAYAGTGGFLGALAAFLAGREHEAPQWLVSGTVFGGIYGLLSIVNGVHSI